MADTAGAGRVVDPVSKAGYELAFEDTFDGDTLEQARWLPHCLPQWSSREAAAQPARPYPKQLVVDWFRGYRPAT
jgi:hypothetical protein